MRKKIIATGISGLVGSRVVELLGNSLEFINFSLDTGVDITNKEILAQKFIQISDVDTVLHLAAFTDVSRAWDQNGDKNGSCYKVNVLGSKNIAQLCKKYNKYLIHISTDFVFDGKNPPSKGYTEENIPKPIEWYGQTKLWAEEEVKKSGCKYSILRPAFPYKAKSSPKILEPNPKLDLVRKIKEKLDKNEQVSMFNDQFITPLFIDDFAKVINKVIEKKPEGIYHCVGSTSLSPYQLAISIAEIFDLDKSLIKKSSLEDFIKSSGDDRPRQRNVKISNKKLEKELGIKMATIKEGLEKIKDQLS